MNKHERDTKLMQEFLNRLDGLNRSEHTIVNYRVDLKYYLDYTQKEGLDTLEMDLQELEAYTVHLKYATYGKGQRYSEGTIVRRITSVRLFYDYLYKREVIDVNPALNLELPRTLEGGEPNFISQSDVKKLIKATQGETHELRDSLILKTFIVTGLRLSELANLNKSDIVGTVLTVRKGKGNKSRKVFIPESLAKEIEDYKQVIKSNKDALFLSQKGKRISNTATQRLVKKYMDRIGLDIEVFSTHNLRHTYASIMLEKGVDIVSIQQALGHSSLETTQKYAHVLDNTRQEAANKMAGIY